MSMCIPIFFNNFGVFNQLIKVKYLSLWYKTKEHILYEKNLKHNDVLMYM